jgi:hypothetical protein
MTQEVEVRPITIPENEKAMVLVVRSPHHLTREIQANIRESVAAGLVGSELEGLPIFVLPSGLELSIESVGKADLIEAIQDSTIGGKWDVMSQGEEQDDLGGVVMTDEQWSQLVGERECSVIEMCLGGGNYMEFRWSLDCSPIGDQAKTRLTIVCSSLSDVQAVMDQKELRAYANYYRSNSKCPTSPRHSDH